MNGLNKLISQEESTDLFRGINEIALNLHNIIKFEKWK